MTGRLEALTPLTVIPRPAIAASGLLLLSQATAGILIAANSLRTGKCEIWCGRRTVAEGWSAQPRRRHRRAKRRRRGASARSRPVSAPLLMRLSGGGDPQMRMYGVFRGGAPRLTGQLTTLSTRASYCRLAAANSTTKSSVCVAYKQSFASRAGIVRN
jgi:hypothetical protein